MDKNDIALTTELKEKVEEACKTFAELKTEQKAREKQVDDTIENLSQANAKQLEDIQNIVAKLEAEEKARKQLEIVIARRPGLDSRQDGKSLSCPEYKTAYRSRARRKVEKIDQELIDNEVKQIIEFYMPHASKDEKDYALKTLSTGSGPDMGYYVPMDDIRGISTRFFEDVPMERLAEVINTANKIVPWVIDDDEISTEEITEYDDPDETNTPKIGIIEYKTHKLTAYPKATEDLLDDASFPVESWLQSKIAEKMGRRKNYWYVRGNNTNQAQGALTLDTWTDSEVYERGKLGSITTAATGALAYEDLVDGEASLLEPYQGNAVWMGHRLTWAYIVKLLDGDDRPLINPQALFQGVQPQILGKPYIFASYLPKPTAGSFTGGDKILMYGDFRQGYLIINRIGMRITRDEITSKNFVKWWVRTRSGGGVKDFQAIKYIIAKS